MVQSYMFRPNTFLRNAFLVLTGIEEDMIFDYSIHVRIGGKRERPEEFKKGGIQYEVEAYLNTTLSMIERCRSINRPFTVYIASDSMEARPYIQDWVKANSHNLVAYMQKVGTTQVMAKGGKEAFKHASKKSDLDRLGLSLEIITDLWYLSRSNIFIGICMSQLARTIVALGRSQGVMSAAIAMDPDMINQITCCRVLKFGTSEGFISVKESKTIDVCPRT